MSTGVDHVLIVSPTFHPHKGGAECLFDDLAALLVERGLGITVLTETPDSSASAGSRRGARVLRLRCPRLPRGRRSKLPHLRAAGAMLLWHWRLIRRARVSAICIGRLDFMAWYPIVLRRVGLFRGRLVLYLHGGELRHLWKGSPGFQRLLVAAFRISDVIVAPSEEMRDEAVRAHPAAAHKIHLVPNGIDVEAVRAGSGRAAPRRYVLFAGRLDPVKNVRVLLDAFAAALPALPGVDLVLAGTGSEEDALREAARALGLASRARFLGSVDRTEVYRLMHGAELVVLPSRVECHPLVVLEAHAAGRIVLGSNVKGIRPLVTEGQGGALFDPDDAAALAALLVRYVDPATRAPLEAAVRRMSVAPWDLRARLAEHLGLWGVVLPASPGGAR